MVEHVPAFKVSILAKLMVEFSTGREGAISMVVAGDPINDQLHVPMVGNQLVDWGEEFEEGCSVVVEQCICGFACESQDEIGD